MTTPNRERTPVPDDSSEEVLVSERLGQVLRAEAEERGILAELLGVARQTDDKLGQLILIEQRRDSREALATAAEQARQDAIAAAERERLEASAEGERARTVAELEERKAHRAWWRSQLEKATIPLIGGLSAILLGIAGVITAWANGMMGDGR